VDVRVCDEAFRFLRQAESVLADFEAFAISWPLNPLLGVIRLCELSYGSAESERSSHQ
jgi:hypothetical protein